jgi:hypothetical protein
LEKAINDFQNIAKDTPEREFLADVRKDILEVEPKILVVLDVQVPNKKQGIGIMLLECYTADAYH